MSRGVTDAAAVPTAASLATLEPLAVSIEEAGRLLGISRDLAYDLVSGRRIVVPLRALEDMVNRCVAAGASFK